MSLSKYAGVAGTWSLNLSLGNPPAESFMSVEETKESVFDPDLRSPADKNDFKDGGKYRSIVKLQMRFEGQGPNDKTYAMGTGWLISPDTIVTAGHNAFDWSGYGRGLGKAVHIKCYIGYQGKDLVDSPDVQCRLAKTIVTPAEWVASRENRHRDMSIIRVDRPFTGNLRLFQYKPTPPAGNIMLGVVGYPADKVIENSDGVTERGAIMYEQFNEVAYTLEAPDNVLKYRISTFGGQSGAPVIRKGGQSDFVIGIHVYGGGDKNQASTIGPKGNDIDSLLKVFTGQLPVVGEQGGIKLVQHQNAAASMSPGTSGADAGFPTAPRAAINPAGDTESFLTDLLKVGQIATPFLGPLGVVASTAMGAIIHATESAWDGADPGQVTASAASKGITERAVLSEAALQAVLELEEGPVLNKILEDMNQTYSANAPKVVSLAPQLAPVIVDTARQMSHDKDNFVRALNSPARPVDGAEGFGDFFGSILKGTISVGVPLLKNESIFDDVLGTAIKIGGGILGGLFGESAFDTPGGAPASDSQVAVIVTKRALLGEAAFQAVSKLSPSELATLQLPSAPSNGFGAQTQPEGFFDFITGTAQKLGGVLKQTMPGVIKAVVPAVVDTVFGQKKQESSFGGQLDVPSNHGLRQRRSLLDMLQDGTLNSQVQQTRISA
ncbi:Trypsin-like cysteine/serine peptidase domain containing protein [Naviculisporaceae sp. PSN 640]